MDNRIMFLWVLIIAGCWAAAIYYPSNLIDIQALQDSWIKDTDAP